MACAQPTLIDKQTGGRVYIKEAARRGLGLWIASGHERFCGSVSQPLQCHGLPLTLTSYGSIWFQNPHLHFYTVKSYGLVYGSI